MPESVMDRIRLRGFPGPASEFLLHMTSLSVTLSKGVLVSPKVAQASRLSFFLLQLRILVVSVEGLRKACISGLPEATYLCK